MSYINKIGLQSSCNIHRSNYSLEGLFFSMLGFFCAITGLFGAFSTCAVLVLIFFFTALGSIVRFLKIH